MRTSHMVASTLDDVELLPGMQQLSQRDLYLDFDIDGKQSQFLLAANANTLKSDFEDCSSGIPSPNASLTKIPNGDSPTISRSKQRTKTLQIFKQSLKSEKDFKLHSPQIKQSSHKSVFTKNSSAATAQNLADKSKKDNSKKTKDNTRGLMYINELWALKYEKHTIKAANIEKELNPIEARYPEPVKRKVNLPELQTKNFPISPQNTLESLPFITSRAAQHNRFKSDSEFALHHLISPKSSKVPIMTNPDTDYSTADSPFFHPRNSSLPYIIPRAVQIPNSGSSNNSLSYLQDVSPLMQSPKELKKTIIEEEESKPAKLNLGSIRREPKSYSLSMSSGPALKFNKKRLTQIQTEFNEDDEEEAESRIPFFTEQASPRFQQIRLKAISQSQKLALNEIIGKCKEERKDSKKVALHMKGLNNLFKTPHLDQKLRSEQSQKNSIIENCKNVLEARTKTKTII